jgi:DNA-directed RNA polymerase subunit M/transcription elongation factor TFIIS
MKFLSQEIIDNPAYTQERKVKILTMASGLNRIPLFATQAHIKKTEFLRLFELGCFKYTLKICSDEKVPAVWSMAAFIKLYNTCCYTATMELINNAELFKLLISGKLQPESVAAMEVCEKNPELYSELIKYEQMQSQVVVTEKSSSLSGNCRNCKKSQVRTSRIYNRGLDEAVGQQMTCVNCGFSWKG